MKVENKRGWPNKMTIAVKHKYDDFEDTEYFRNIPTLITKAENNVKHPFQLEMRYRMLYTLLVIAGFNTLEIKNFKEFNEGFNPLEIECAYTDKVFKRFELMRPYVRGQLKRNLTEWYFQSDEFELRDKKVFSISPYRMPGDQLSRWIRMRYKEKGIFYSAFFAEIKNGTFIPQDKYSKIYSFLIDFRSGKTTENQEQL